MTIGLRTTHRLIEVWSADEWSGRKDEGVDDQPSQPRFMTLRQVADLLRCTQGQVYSLVRSGQLKGIQIGGRNQWRVERSKLEEYIQEAYRRTAENLERPQDDDPSDDQ